MAVSTINNALVPVNFARGSVTSGTVPGGGSNATFSVTFPTSMARIPTIVTSITQNGSFRLWVVSVNNISTNGFTVAVRNNSGSDVALTSNRRIDWIAACD